MIDKDESPISAVDPTSEQRVFLLRVVEAATDYARSRNHTDMFFQGHFDQTYFGAYSTKVRRRGAGKFVFGFAKRGGVIHFAFPVDVPEPYRVAKSWIGDPTRNRAMIELPTLPDEEMQLYLIDLAKRSIDFHYQQV